MSPSRRMQITDNDRVARVDRDIILNGINKNNFTTIDTMRIDKEASPITEKKLADLFGLKNLRTRLQAKKEGKPNELLINMNNQIYKKKQEFEDFKVNFDKLQSNISVIKKKNYNQRRLSLICKIYTI